ncbi:MAG TPA: GNAT family N-acetyltransferase [Spongiibacteraceae bacterium]|nr:GNAT family N-acetyltransferase [Spongiibacteraceae bacterium]
MQIIDLNDAPQHIPQLAEWHHRQWSYLNPQSTVERRIEELRTHLCVAPIPSTYIAIADTPLDEPMGSASLVAHDMDTHPELTAWLASVFVDPRHRKKSVGAALVKRIMLRAEEAGIATLSLFTPDQELFYRRLGWSTLVKENYRGAEVTIMQVNFPH